MATIYGTLKPKRKHPELLGDRTPKRDPHAWVFNLPVKPPGPDYRPRRLPKRTSVPKSPDYSTPEAVTARCQEAAWDGGCPTAPDHGHAGTCRWGEHVKFLRACKRLIESDGKPYRDLMKALRKAA